MDDELRSCDVTTIPPLAPIGKYRARVISVYDGDTVTVVHRWGDRLYKSNVRLLDIDAPELHPRMNTTNRTEVIRQAKNAREALATMVQDKIVDYQACGWDKYGGRVLGRLWSDGKCVNQEMLKVEGVKAYNGGAKN